MEAFIYDETGQPLAASFVDYLIPTATEMPLVEALIFEDAPSPLNPLGARVPAKPGSMPFEAPSLVPGVGEAGIVG